MAEDGAAESGTPATAFVISPIGKSGSSERRRADGLYDGVLTPVFERLGVSSTRADRIERSGMITMQIVRHIVDAPLVVADLSGANPNVYYELGLADAFRVPVVRFVDDASRLPFDARPDRTIELADENGSIEVLAAVAAQATFEAYARDALENRSVDSVVSMAELRATWDSQTGSGGGPEQQMLRALVQDVDELRRRVPQPGSTPPADEMDILHRLAQPYTSRYYGDATILRDTDGYIIDFGQPIEQSSANFIIDRFAEIVGDRKVTLLHGTEPDRRQPDPLYGDEEPF